MKGSESVFEHVQLLCYKCHKTNPTRGGSCIDSPHRTKIKETRNPIEKK